MRCVALDRRCAVEVGAGKIDDFVEVTGGRTIFERGSSEHHNRHHSDRNNNNTYLTTKLSTGWGFGGCNPEGIRAPPTLSKGLLVSLPRAEVEKSASRAYGSSDHAITRQAKHGNASSLEQKLIAAEVCWKQEPTLQYISLSLSPLTAFFPLNAHSS